MNQLTEYPTNVVPLPHAAAQAIMDSARHADFDVTAAAQAILADADFLARIAELPSKITAEEYDTLRADDALDCLEYETTATEVYAAVVSRADLAKAIAACVKVVERRSVIPILNNVLLQGMGDYLSVRGTASTPATCSTRWPPSSPTAWSSCCLTWAARRSFAGSARIPERAAS